VSPRSRKAAIHQQGDACSPRFPLLDRHANVNASAVAPNLRTLGVLEKEPGLIRHVDRHLPVAATSGVPLFDRRHAW
jgi:hypothetical protein